MKVGGEEEMDNGSNKVDSWTKGRKERRERRCLGGKEEAVCASRLGEFDFGLIWRGARGLDCLDFPRLALE